MSSRARVALILPLSMALVSASTLLADTVTAAKPDASHATIRGSGKDVTIVYGGAPIARPRRGTTGMAAAKPANAATSAIAEPDVVGDATRLAARGADDPSLITFLRNHQSELPPVVEADAVKRLRKAGAGAEVITDLSRMTALDIGETAEGPPVRTAYAGEGFPGMDAMPFANGDGGYPFYGAYGSPGFAPRHHQNRFFGPPRHAMGSPRPVFPGRPPMHGGATRGGMPRIRQP